MIFLKTIKREFQRTLLPITLRKYFSKFQVISLIAFIGTNKRITEKTMKFLDK